MLKVINNKELTFVSRDSLDTCAKYVKALSNKMLEVHMLYRYGKPNIYKQSLKDFKKERLLCNNPHEWIIETK